MCLSDTPVDGYSRDKFAAEGLRKHRVRGAVDVVRRSIDPLGKTVGRRCQQLPPPDDLDLFA